jgi:hypothetical protein
MHSYSLRQGVLGLPSGNKSYCAEQYIKQEINLVCSGTCSELVLWVRSFSLRQGVFGLPSGNRS